MKNKQISFRTDVRGVEVEVFINVKKIVETLGRRLRDRDKVASFDGAVVMRRVKRVPSK